MLHDNFKHKAKDWDKNSNTNTKTVSEAILEKFILHDEMELLDFGTGAGLLGFEIATSQILFEIKKDDVR